MPEPQFPPHAIAIVGLAGRFPGTPGLDGFWADILAGREVLDVLTEDDLDAAGVSTDMRADTRYVRKATSLPESTAFDAEFFGISPREAQVLDPQHRIFLECVWEAMEHAGHAPGESDAVVGVYAGTSMNTYLLNRLTRDPELVEAVGGYQVMLGNDKDFLCTRASYKLDLKGPSMTVQTACSTSLVAVEAACRALVDGECDMALAGGVSVMFPERAGYLYQEGMIFSPDGHCRPFDAAAAGTRAGAGAGVVALKRFADAQRDGDTIHAVIRGIAVNNDGGAKAGYTAPSLEGQVEVIAMAQALAGVEPGSIGHVEAHGTATPLGDPIEFAALTRAFRAKTQDIGFCRLGSLKANIGHLDAAAGIAGLIKTVLVLKHGRIPPLVNFATPNPTLGMEVSPFAASGEESAWPAIDGPRRAAVSSFGIGGTNAHAVLEQAPTELAMATDGKWQLLPISARNEAALAEMASALARDLAVNEASLGDIAWTLQDGRKHSRLRWACVSRDKAAAAGAFASELEPSLHEGGERQVAFLFPGQGSQHPGMGADLYRDEPVYRDFIDHCAERLVPELGIDLREAMFGTDAERLRDTAIAQPALFVTEMALAELLHNWGIAPRAMIGHSIGEFAAAVLAGVFTLEDALRIVAVRGRLMSGLPAGAMAAVPLPPEELPAHLTPGVEIAAVNAANLCTLSGPVDALARTVADLAAIGVEARTLHTSHAFHSAMMEPILDAFRACVAQAERHAPSLPYVSCLTGDWITPEQATSPDYYADQLRHTVRFAEGVARLAADEALYLLEVGSSTALTQLVRQNLRPDRVRISGSTLPPATSTISATPALLEAVGRTWQAGVTVNFAALHGGAARRRVPLPTYPFQRQVYDSQPGDSERAAAAPIPPADGSKPMIYVPSWTRDVAGDAALEGVWIVAGGSAGRRDAAAVALAERGADTRIAGDISAIAEILAEPDGERVSGAALLGALDGVNQRAMFAELAELAKALSLADRRTPFQLIIATQGAQSVLDETVSDAEAALALGAALALPAELPWLRARAVDLPATGWADCLAREAGQSDNEPQSAWRGGRRWIRSYPELQQEAASPLTRGGVYLITGGLGGIGLSLARWLAEEWQAKLLLTARTAPEPGDPRQEAISAIEAAGGQVIVSAADAGDEAAMRRAISEARKAWGRLDGVVHAAGVSGTGKIALGLEPEDIAATLAPKVDGLAVLRAILGEDALDFVVLMGSINGVLGMPGTLDYSAANAVLDSFAEGGARPAGWKRTIAIDWSAWRDVGMARALDLPVAMRAAHRERLRGAIATDAGVAAFARALASPADRLVVTSFALAEAIRASRHDSMVGQANGANPQAAAAAPAIGGGTLRGGAPATPLEQRLGAIWAELIGVADIGRDDDFFMLGGHSLLATRLLARVRENEKAELQLRDIFDRPTLRGFAERVEEAGLNNDTEAGDDDREEMFF